jgi:hypothetical protein
VERYDDWVPENPPAPEASSGVRPTDEMVVAFVFGAILAGLPWTFVGVGVHGIVFARERQERLDRWHESMNSELGLPPREVKTAESAWRLFGWFYAGGCAGVGYLLALVGQIWLLVLIARECPSQTIIYGLLIPIFTWYFAWRRWDVAGRPLLCTVTGVLLLLFAA